MVHLDQLARESEEEGFRFLRRLRDEYISGANRFSLLGEILLGAYKPSVLLAIGGLQSRRNRHAA